MTSQAANVTVLLQRADAGDLEAQAALYAQVEPVLRRIAGVRKQGLAVGDALRTTVLIDDAFVKLVGSGVSQWSPGDREKFYAFASTKMQSLLIDEVRRRMAGKRNGGKMPTSLVAALASCQVEDGNADVDFLIDLKDQLKRLQIHDEDAAVVFRIKYFMSCTFDEIADLLGRPNRAAVVRPYGRAIAWLRVALE